MPALISAVVPAGRLSDHAQPRLITDDLVVRPWSSADVGGVVEAYSDPDIQQWHARSITHPEAQQWVASHADRWQAETGADWAIVDGHGLLGRVGLRTVNLFEGWAEAAYWVLPAARGRNVAARALGVVTNWMFTEIGLHRIELVHSVANQASCRVASKAGYLLEGTKRQQTLHPDGWHDMHLHARLRIDPIAEPT